MGVLYISLLVAKTQADIEAVSDATLMQGIAHYRAEMVNLMRIANPEQAGFSFAECELQLDRVQVAYDDVKAALDDTEKSFVLLTAQQAQLTR